MMFIIRSSGGLFYGVFPSLSEAEEWAFNNLDNEDWSAEHIELVV